MSERDESEDIREYNEDFPYDKYTQDLIRIIKERRFLPTKGLLKIVLEESPVWAEKCKDYDNRGSGITLGRRLKRMRNNGLVYQRDGMWLTGR